MLTALLSMWLMGNLGATCRGTPTDAITQKPTRYDWAGPYLDDPYTDGAAPRVGIDQSLGAQLIVEGGDRVTLPTDPMAPDTSPALGVASLDAERWKHHQRRQRAIALGVHPPLQYQAGRADLLVLHELARGVHDGDLPWECILEPEDDADAVLTLLQTNVGPQYEINWTYGGDGTADTGCLDEDGNAVVCEFVNSSGSGLTPSATGEGLLKELCLQDPAGADCNNAYKRASYYLARGLVDRDADGDIEVSFTAVEFDLSKPACVAWNVANTLKVIEQGGYDGINLNHKMNHFEWDTGWTVPPKISLSAYKSASGCTNDAGAGCAADWMEASTGPNPNAVGAGSNMEDTPTSSVPKDCSRAIADLAAPWNPTTPGGGTCSYYHGPYWAGQLAYGQALQAAGVRFSFLLSQQYAFPSSTLADDPNTAGVNEAAAYVREVLHRADPPVVDFISGASQADDIATLAAFPSALHINSGRGKRTTLTSACATLGTNTIMMVFPTISVAGDGTVTWQPYDDGTDTVTEAGTWYGAISCNCPFIGRLLDFNQAGCVADETVLVGAPKADNTPETTVCPANPGDRIAVTVTQGGKTFWTWYDAR